MKDRIFIVQLGSPKSPKVKDVRVYLKDFLGDPRVIDLNPLLWKIILYLFILPFRPKKSGEAYGRIWNEKTKSFPLIDYTNEFSRKIAEHIPDADVESCFLISEPRFSDVVAQNGKKSKLSDERWIIFPGFPQNCEATTSSVWDMFSKGMSRLNIMPDVLWINNYHRSKAFIDSSANLIHEYFEKYKKENFHVDILLISFHGIPKRRIPQNNDPYFLHCMETFYILKKILSVGETKVICSFQSRFGSEEWLKPYTDEIVDKLVDRGKKKIAVYCPAFVVDCLETIDEIGIELEEQIAERGGEMKLIPCLNARDEWVQKAGEYIDGRRKGIPLSELEYPKPKETKMNTESTHVKLKETPLSDEAKKVLKIVFFTLFLDLVGFSIIFPMFPALAKYYLEVNPDNYFLRLILDSISYFTGFLGNTGPVSPIVLFGGALGALYSFLQFLCAPLWGGFSDRFGRKPILIISVAGLAFSYLLWGFSGSFSLLVLARFIGGIMGGNISTATAVVADITTKDNRSKGMAFVGIAFAFGFIIGPALGGILCLVDLTKVNPALESFGVNPFSLPAFFAMVLSILNLFFICKKLPETRKASEGEVQNRVINPLKLFKPLPYKGVNGTNIGHFLFLFAFSGMEFTLTFLAVDRLGYSSLDNGLMFVYIGLVLAFVQGGVVRRKARSVGEKKMATIGLVAIIPGLVILGIANSGFMLYLGLTFLAIGSAMAVPCFTSLVSLYTPAREQGRSIGIFRSLGALSRVFGPLMASIVYWKWGPSNAYYLGALFLLIPIFMLVKLPNPDYGSAEG